MRPYNKETTHKQKKAANALKDISPVARQCHSDKSSDIAKR
jgi:hypothetical protein